MPCPYMAMIWPFRIGNPSCLFPPRLSIPRAPVHSVVGARHGVAACPYMAMIRPFRIGNPSCLFPLRLSIPHACHHFRGRGTARRCRVPVHGMDMAFLDSETAMVFPPRLSIPRAPVISVVGARHGVAACPYMAMIRPFRIGNPSCLFPLRLPIPHACRHFRGTGTARRCRVPVHGHNTAFLDSETAMAFPPCDCRSRTRSIHSVVRAGTGSPTTTTFKCLKLTFCLDSPFPALYTSLCSKPLYLVQERNLWNTT